MPWQETLLMDQRVQFIADYQRDVFDVAELARRYGISRKHCLQNGSDRWASSGDRQGADRSITRDDRRIVRTAREPIISGPAGR